MIKHLAVSLPLVLCLALPAFADASLGPLTVSAPWSRATPPGARVGGGYLTIRNNGGTPDRLLSATSPVSEKTELHEMKTDNGVMTMRAADDGVEIPAGGSVTFSPGGYHIMFIRPKSPFVAGATVPLTLVFEKAGKLDVALPVEPIGSPGPVGAEPMMMDGKSMPGMKMDGAAP